jgi:ATP-dependent Lon protease
MEVLRLDGYTARDKTVLAQRHIVPQAVVECGLPPASVGLSEAAIETLVREYSQEAGVRELARAVMAVCRAHVHRSAERGEKPQPITFDTAAVREILGVPTRRRRRAAPALPPGSAYGLSWTASDGEVLPIECALLPHGTGKLVVTGQLGDVLKESIEVAVAALRRSAAALGIAADFRKDRDLHVHLPDTAVKKEGPSAGLAIAIALLSHQRERSARADTAMTGELALHGKVTAIGGVKTKLLAAAAAGIARALVPEDNRVDVEHEFLGEDVPVEVIYVSDLDAAIAAAFHASSS